MEEIHHSLPDVILVGKQQTDRLTFNLTGKSRKWDNLVSLYKLSQFSGSPEGFAHYLGCMNAERPERVLAKHKALAECETLHVTET